MNSERAASPIGLELSITTTERFNTINQNSEVLEADDEFKTFGQSKILQRLKLLQIFLGKIKAKHIVSMLLFLVFFFNYLVQDPLNIESLQIAGTYTAKTWDNNTWNILIDNRLSTFERALDSDTSLFIFQQYDNNIDFAELPNKEAVGCILNRPLNLISCEMKEINDLTRPFILLPVLTSSSNIAFWKTIEQTNLEDSSIVSYRNQDLETILSLELQDSSIKRATFKDSNGSFSIIKHNDNAAPGSERGINQVYLEAVKNSLNEGALSPLLSQRIPDKIDWTRFDVPKFVIKCENWNIFSQCSIL